MVIIINTIPISTISSPSIDTFHYTIFLYYYNNIKIVISKYTHLISQREIYYHNNTYIDAIGGVHSNELAYYTCL